MCCTLSGDSTRTFGEVEGSTWRAGREQGEKSNGRYDLSLMGAFLPTKVDHASSLPVQPSTWNIGMAGRLVWCSATSIVLLWRDKRTRQMLITFSVSMAVLFLVFLMNKHRQAGRRIAQSPHQHYTPDKGQLRLTIQFTHATCHYWHFETIQCKLKGSQSRKAVKIHQVAGIGRDQICKGWVGK